MAHRHDGLDAGLAYFGHRAPEGDRLRAHRHAAEIGVEIDPRVDAPPACTQRRADFLPIVLVAPRDGLCRRGDELLVALRDHFASSLRPSRIRFAASAPSPALRAAAATAEAACGRP